MLQCPPAALVDLRREQPGTYSKPYTSGQRQAQHTWFTCMRPRAHTHTGPHFPDFIQWHVHSGDGIDTGWGLICPGALGAPHTMHYGWEGAQGGLVAPAEACVPGKRW